MTSTDFYPDDPARPAAKGAGEPIQSFNDSVGDLKQAASDKIGAHADDLKERGTDKVNQATDTAGASLGQVAAQLRQAADGLGQEQAWADKAFRQGADGIDKIAGYLTHGRFDDFARDLQRLASSYPAAFLAGSVAVGFIAARVARAAAESASETAVETEIQQATFEKPVQVAIDPYAESRSFAATSDDAGYTRPGAI